MACCQWTLQVSMPARAAWGSWMREGPTLRLTVEVCVLLCRPTTGPHPLYPRAVMGNHSTTRSVAIEADGPLHFSPQAPYEPLTHTTFRNRLLEYHG